LKGYRRYRGPGDGDTTFKGLIVLDLLLTPNAYIPIWRLKTFMTDVVELRVRVDDQLQITYIYENIKIGNTFYKNMNLFNYFIQISGRRLVNTFFHAITKKVKNFHVKVMKVFSEYVCIRLTTKQNKNVQMCHI